MAAPKTMQKILVLGDAGVGKTSLIRQLKYKVWMQEYKTTIGVDFVSEDVTIDGQEVTMLIWDTAGQERYQALGAAFYRGADAAVLVFDATNSNSREHLTVWMEEFLMFVGDNPSQVPLVVVANKMDAVQQGNYANINRAREWCDENYLPLFLTSAKEATNVEKLFHTVARLGLQKIDQECLPVVPFVLLEPDNDRKQNEAPDSCCT